LVDACEPVKQQHSELPVAFLSVDENKVYPGQWKVMKFSKTIFRPGTSWKITQVM